MVYRTLDAVHYPGRVTAVLLVGDKLQAVGGSAERGTMGQFGAILVVGTADGESELREIALEGTQVLAENRLKLVEAYRRLAAESLHEVLVGIVTRGIVEEILAQRRRKEIGEERSLEDAALAHEDEYHLVHHLRRYPRHHHRHQPLLEEIAEEFLVVLIARLLHHMDAVGELVDIVWVLVWVPFRQTPEIFLQGIVRETEITVDDAVQYLLGKMQPSFVHLRPERVLDVVVDAGEVRILAGVDHAASQLEEARYDVVLKLIVGSQPLLDGLHPRLAAVCLAGTVEVPGTQEVDMLVARFHHAGGVGIVGAKLPVGILLRLILVDAIPHADLAEVADILVVPARFKVVAPLLQELRKQSL